LNQQLTVFCQLNEAIPFNRLHLDTWLLDPSTNLNDHATRLHGLMKLSKVWISRDSSCLHVVLRIRDPRAFFTLFHSPTLRPFMLTQYSVGMEHGLSSAEYPVQEWPDFEKGMCVACFTLLQSN
jgi:hypothetical protein